MMRGKELLHLALELPDRGIPIGIVQLHARDGDRSHVTAVGEKLGQCTGSGISRLAPAITGLHGSVRCRDQDWDRTTTDHANVSPGAVPALPHVALLQCPEAP